MSSYFRRGAFLGAAALSLLLVAPAQAQTCSGDAGIGDALNIPIICDAVSPSQGQQQVSNNANNNNNNINVQQQQAQAITGASAAAPAAAPTTTRVVHVVPSRRFFVRRAVVGRRAFFVRNVVLARTGFNAWILALAGIGCMAGGAALMARRRRSSA